MKQKLLFASSLALIMASCTQTEYDQLSQTQVEGKGIKFTTSIDEGVGTRAELSPSGNVFNHRWYADKDKIGVLYKEGCYVQPIAGQTGLVIGGTTGGWMGHANGSASNPFVFKASASGTTGYFVAADDNNVLELANPTATPNPDKVPTFRAYWPVTPTIDLVADVAKVTLPVLATQTQTGIQGQGIVNNAFMISESISDAEYDANDNSVSKDRFSLAFKRVDPIVYFKIKAATLAKDANREYAVRYGDLFKNLGVLKTVTLEAKGGIKADGTVGTVTTPSNLTHNTDAAWDMSKEDLSEGFVGGTTGATAEITTTMAPATQWSNEATAFMVVAPINRKAFFDKSEKEQMTATYTFAKVQLEKSITTNKNWMAEEKNWYGFPSESGYDLDQLPYIAYATGSGVVLQINPSFTGKLSDIFEGNGNLKEIKKTDGTVIHKTDIEEFVSKVNITTDADFATIKTLPLTHVTLMANTSIPSKAFGTLTTITYLNLPKVTTVANVDAFPAATYKEVYMGSYDFSNAAGTNQEAVRGKLLVAANLEKADISAVADLNAGFPQTGVKFTDFVKLTDITVMSGALVGGSTFQGCTVLANVQYPAGIENGSVNLAEGSNSQFLNCKALPAIAISNKIIPAAAFQGCTALADITDANAKGIQPTQIGINAFESCEAITDMDLSVAKTIGKAAFKGCKALVGNDNVEADKTVLYVNSLTHVSDDVFSGCAALEFISFGTATTVGTGFLTGTTCKEIEFLHKFAATASITTATGSFGTTPANTILFCNKAQEDITVNSIKVGKTDFAFKSINAKY